MNFETLNVEVSGAVGRLLDRPDQLNAMNSRTKSERNEIDVEC